MPQRKSTAERLSLLEEKRKALDAAIKREQAKARTEDRKRDTRRKIIAGALALEHAGIDPAFDAALQRLLHRYVIRAEDRALFDLPPKPDDAFTQATPSETAQEPGASFIPRSATG
jgi:hypothetical protein